MSEQKLVHQEKNSLLAPFRRPVPVQKTSAAKEQITSLLAKDAVYSGDMLLRDGIKVDGHVHGSITVQNKEALVVISAGASVEGNIDAGRVYVSGTVKGGIRAMVLTLANTACVDGDLYYKTLQVAEGAEMLGRIHKLNEKSLSDDISPVAVTPAA